MGQNQCDVCGCTSHISTVHLHRFPRTVERALKWVEFCKNPRLSGIPPEKLFMKATICNKHFEPSQFKTPAGLRINLNAEPTLFPAFPLPPSVEAAYTPSAVTCFSSSLQQQSLHTSSTLPPSVEAANTPSAVTCFSSSLQQQSMHTSSTCESLPEVPLQNNQERTRQSVSPPNVLQSNRHINTQLGQGNFHMIEETPEMHSLITLPYLEQAVSNLQWVYRILSGEEECERIVYESPNKDDKNGFLLIKDTKWDGSNLDKLHLIAIAYRPGIMSLRDLGVEHLCLLQNINSTGKAVIIKKYGVLSSQLRIFLKYAPEFYHLHVHFTAMNDDVCGPYFGSAQPLFSVIQNIEIFPKYYQVARLGLCVEESDELFKQFEAKGLVERNSTFQETTV